MSSSTATATMQKSTGQITNTESLVLMKNMMRIALSSIANVRGLFEQDCFKTLQYDQSFSIQMLECASVDNSGKLVATNTNGFTFMQWLENGVFKALDAGYIDAITFVIFDNKENHTNNSNNSSKAVAPYQPLETYEFKVQYGNKDDNTHPTLNGLKIDSKESLRMQAKRFVRSLVEFTGTLDDLPDKIGITFVIQYNDSTPDDYSPEYFTHSPVNTYSIKEKKPLRIKIEGVTTSKASMNVKFVGSEQVHCNTIKSILPDGVNLNSQLYDDDDNRQSSQVSVAPIDSQVTISQPCSQKTVSSSKNRIAPRNNNNVAESNASIRDYLYALGQTSVSQCANALDVDYDTVQKALQHMEEDGISKLCGNVYSMLSTPSINTSKKNKLKRPFDSASTICSRHFENESTCNDDDSVNGDDCYDDDANNNNEFDDIQEFSAPAAVSTPAVAVGSALDPNKTPLYGYKKKQTMSIVAPKKKNQSSFSTNAIASNARNRAVKATPVKYSAPQQPIQIKKRRMNEFTPTQPKQRPYA